MPRRGLTSGHLWQVDVVRLVHLYFLLVTMQLYLVFPALLAWVRRSAHVAGRVLAARRTPLPLALAGRPWKRPAAAPVPLAPVYRLAPPCPDLYHQAPSSA